MPKTKLNFGNIVNEDEKKIAEITNDAPLKQMGEFTLKRPKTINISVTLWPQDVELLDQLCTEMGVSRSAMIRILLRKNNG